MKIKYNKKLLLAYLNIGIVSFCLTGCKIKDKSVKIVTPVETIMPSYDETEIIWHIPEGYRLVNRNGEPQFVKLVKKKVTRTIDLNNLLPDDYKLVTIFGQQRVIKTQPDGSLQIVLPTSLLPNDYQLGIYDGKLVGIKEVEVNVLNYVKVTDDDYDLPEGYEIALINGKFVGIKVLEDETKILVKND